jgi:hypothetical protein
MIGLPGDTVDSVHRGIDYLQRARPFSEVQVFNLSILPGTAFRREAEQLGLVYQSRPPYYVLNTPTLDVEQIYALMEEAQEAFGVEFDALPLPQLARIGPPGRPSIGCQIDLDAQPPAPLPPPADRALVFTLWLRAADFARRRREAAALIGQAIADNPHTTLHVVVEPTGDPARLGEETLERLLAACHPAPSYLDWYYSLHPGHLPGAKRLMVLARIQDRPRLGREWIARIGNCATLLWRGGGIVEEDLDEHEYRLTESAL